MSEISLRNISKRYNPGLFKKKIQAVANLHLEVEKGQVFGLIGPNGAGKSTTIRMILGLIHPDEGEVLFRGKSLRDAGIQREIGYLPENPYLYDYLTLQELLNFCGRASDLERSIRRKRIDELLEKVDMTAARDKPLRTFSKGMLQRAGICFALLHDPTVVILDEPMSGLDPVGRKLVFDLIMELREQGKTIFFCSHILSDVERLCDRIGVLVSGRLIREFTRTEFLADTSRSIHLILGPLTPTQRQTLAKFSDDFLEYGDGYLLSLKPGQMGEAVRSMQEIGVEVLATRTERTSLEELFLQTIEGSGL